MQDKPKIITTFAAIFISVGTIPSLPATSFPAAPSNTLQLQTIKSLPFFGPRKSQIAQRCNSKYMRIFNPTGGSVIIRDKNHANSNKVGELENGILVEFRGWDELGQWADIITQGGLQGWVKGTYLICDFE